MSAASLAEITRLSAAERIQLAEDIWERLPRSRKKLR